MQPTDQHTSSPTSTGQTQVRCAATVVAPEVAERILARQATGQQVSQIGRDLQLTPAEIRSVLRAAEPTVPVDVEAAR